MLKALKLVNSNVVWAGDSAACQRQPAAANKLVHVDTSHFWAARTTPAVIAAVLIILVGHGGAD